MLPYGRAEMGEATRRRQLRALSVAALATLALGACSVVDAPVQWYRDATGLSKNDDMGKGSNQKNLEAGSKEPYPNLAEVPQPPENAMSSMDREALRQSLAADRQNAQYTEDQLRAGSPVPGLVAPPPPPAAPPSLVLPNPPAAAPEPANKAQAETAAAPAQVAQAPSATETPAPAAQPAPPKPAKSAPAKEPPPAESTLAAPQPREMPQGESPSPPPPAPQIAPAPAVAESPVPRAAAAAGAGAPAEPAPMPPQVAATAPPPRPAGPAAGSNAARQIEVADVTFMPDSSKVDSALHETLVEVATLHKTRQGKIRIVGYAAKLNAGGASRQDLANYDLALERAKSVAASLTELGVPAADIVTEAAVEAAGDPRAEIYMNNK